ncbi:MAG: polyphosphate kinase 1 [Bacteroidota bacterium]
MPRKVKYHNKEISWLSFNYRVLLESRDTSNPLFERIKFLSIYDSNLQEFFRNKLGALKRLSQIEKTNSELLHENPKKNLNKVRSTISKHYQESQSILYKEIIPDLTNENINIINTESISKSECFSEVHAFFRTKILTFLKPFILQGQRNKDIFLDDTPYFLVWLRSQEKPTYGLVNIPSNKIPRFYEINCLNGYNFIPIDDIIRLNLESLFDGYKIEEATTFKVSRNELFNIEDEYSGILKDKIKNGLEDYHNSFPTSVIYDRSISEDSLSFLKKFFQFKNKELIPGYRYQDIKDLVQLRNPYSPKLELAKVDKLIYPPFNKNKCIFKKINQQDHLLHFPYHSYDYVLRFFNEASTNHTVKEIRITLYRVAKNSSIMSALINAANNGKKVIAFIEIKARDDEAHNIYWAEKMEQAGVTVVYSIPELKVHAKMALVIKEEPEGEKYYTFLSTGNFNEQTSNFYSDFGFFTCKKKITQSVFKTFEYIHKKKPLKKIEDLLVTKYNLKKKFLKLINNEILNHKLGKPSQIIVKVNNLEENDMIDKLYEAAEAGVEVVLIVRSICCFNYRYRKFEKVKLIRLVDSYLEHTRVMYFLNNQKEIVYLSSADWMQRNLHNRVEIAFPVKNKKLKALIRQVLYLQISDNQKAVSIDGNLNNIKIKNKENHTRAQYETYQFLSQSLIDQ